jgi:hypothetical protein
LNQEERAKANTVFADVASGSCAAKQRLFDDLTKENLAPLSDDDLRAVLDKIDSYRSASFRKGALRRFLAGVPEARERAVADRVLSLALPYAAVIKGTPWLERLAEKSGKSPDGEKEPYQSFDQARQLSGRRQCSKAKDVLSSALASLKKDQSAALEDAVATAKAIDGCYRSRDAKLRTDFWVNLTKRMEATFGFAGWAEAKLRLGYIHWARDEYADAKPLFQEVIEKTAGKDKRYEGRAVFALARIAESESVLDKAAAYYKDYLRASPTRRTSKNR